MQREVPRKLIEDLIPSSMFPHLSFSEFVEKLEGEIRFSIGLAAKKRHARDTSKNGRLYLSEEDTIYFLLVCFGLAEGYYGMGVGKRMQVLAEKHGVTVKTLTKVRDRLAQPVARILHSRLFD